MKKILFLGLSIFLLNATVPVTITGKAEGVGEKPKKEALSDLSNQISVEVSSDYTQIAQKLRNSYKDSKKSVIEVKSELPLKSVRFVYEDGSTLAVLNSTLALKVYKEELNRLKKEINSIQNSLKKNSSNTQKYRLYKQLLEDVDMFNKNKIVAVILRGENLPTINITEAEIKSQLENLSQKVDSIDLAAEILSRGITQNKIYIYPIKTDVSDEVTQFARVLKEKLSNYIHTTYKPKDAKYFIRGNYEILNDKIFVTIKLLDMNNNVLKSNSVTLRQEAYSSMNYNPQTISFDESINNSFTKNEFKVDFGIKGYYSSKGIDLRGGDSINLVVKTNKEMCYYIVGHTLESNGRKYSYLLPLKDGEGREAFIDRITGSDVNKNVALFDMDVVKPFGRETLQLFAQTLVHGKCNIQIPKCEWHGDLCIITGSPSKVVKNTRALALHKPKKAKKAEAMIDFTSFEK